MVFIIISSILQLQQLNWNLQVLQQGRTPNIFQLHRVCCPCDICSELKFPWFTKGFSRSFSYHRLTWTNIRQLPKPLSLNFKAYIASREINQSNRKITKKQMSAKFLLPPMFLLACFINGTIEMAFFRMTFCSSVLFYKQCVKLHQNDKQSLDNVVPSFYHFENA